MPTAAKPQVHRISIEEAREPSRKAVFVDARSATALRRNPTQIPGAIHVPIKEFKEQAKRLPRHRTLIIYCT